MMQTRHHEGGIDRDLFGRMQQGIASKGRQGRESGMGAATHAINVT